VERRRKENREKKTQSMGWGTGKGEEKTPQQKKEKKKGKTQRTTEGISKGPHREKRVQRLESKSLGRSKRMRTSGQNPGDQPEKKTGPGDVIYRKNRKTHRPVTGTRPAQCLSHEESIRKEEKKDPGGEY